MKTLILLVLIITLLVGGGVALAQSSGAGPGQSLSIQPATSSGGNYQLASLIWQVSGTASGGGYALASPYVPTLRGSGCCCTYLPCILRNW